jgi:hypothetical protein
LHEGGARQLRDRRRVRVRSARPLDWIEQPTGYVSVGFVATSDPDRRAMHGRIVEAQCGEIELHRNGAR